MMDSYPVFTVAAGEVAPGATVLSRTIANYRVNVIEVGESGRGRALGSLIVEFPDHHLVDEEKEERILAASLSQTQSGRPKLLAQESPTTGDYAIVVMLSPIGFRGSNELTGDRHPEWAADKPLHLPFPGRVLCQGTIAQGDAGYAGSGSQHVIQVARGTWWRLGISGRLYGAPREHFYHWDGERLIALTAEERTLLDLWSRPAACQ